MESFLLNLLIFFALSMFISAIFRRPGGRRGKRDTWSGSRVPKQHPRDVNAAGKDGPPPSLNLDIPDMDDPDRIHVPVDPDQPIRFGKEGPAQAAPQYNLDIQAPDTATKDDPFKQEEADAAFKPYEAKADDVQKRLAELDAYLEQGVISKKEYKQMRWEILKGQR